MRYLLESLRGIRGKIFYLVFLLGIGGMTQCLKPVLLSDEILNIS